MEIPLGVIKRGWLENPCGLAIEVDVYKNVPASHAWLPEGK